MRVFKVADGSSWVARVQEGQDDGGSGPHSGYDTIVFEPDPVAEMLRLVYRPTGWLEAASVEELVAALEEGLVVRSRWTG